MRGKGRGWEGEGGERKEGERGRERGGGWRGEGGEGKGKEEGEGEEKGDDCDVINISGCSCSQSICSPGGVPPQ